MIRKATILALGGNLSAMRFVMDRTCGRSTEAPSLTEPLGVELPTLQTAEDCTVAIGRLIEAVCTGETDRDLAKLLIDAIQARLKAIEVNELEERIEQLEETSGQVNGR